MQENHSEQIIVGTVGSAYGIKGWLHINSLTDPKEKILEYDPWYLNINGEEKAIKIVDGRAHGKGVVAHIENCDDRDVTRQFVGLKILIQRAQMPELKNNEYYWADLEGLTVTTINGETLGKIDHLMETGANDVLVIKGEKEHMLPYLPEKIVKSVDLNAQQMIVDWDPEF